MHDLLERFSMVENNRYRNARLFCHAEYAPANRLERGDHLVNNQQDKRRRGLLGRRDDYVIPWEQVRRVGADIILIESELDKTRCPRRKKEFF